MTTGACVVPNRAPATLPQHMGGAEGTGGAAYRRGSTWKYDPYRRT